MSGELTVSPMTIRCSPACTTVPESWALLRAVYYGVGHAGGEEEVFVVPDRLPVIGHPHALDDGRAGAGVFDDELELRRLAIAVVAAVEADLEPGPQLRPRALHHDGLLLGHDALLLAEDDGLVHGHEHGAQADDREGGRRDEVAVAVPR